MTLKQYLILMTIGTIICWLTWLLLIFSVSPADAGLTGLLFFYFSLGLAILGTFSVLGFIIKRSVIKNDDAVFRHVKKTFRQGMLVSLYLIILLVLQSQNLLSWWNALILVMIFIIIEFAYLSKHGSATPYVK